MLETGSAETEQVRLFVEELCCDLCRFGHADAGASPRDVRVRREAYLGVPGAFADAIVSPKSLPPYFLEVKLGYTRENLVGHLAKKYGTGSPATKLARKLVLVVDARRAGTSVEDDLGSILAGSDASLDAQLRAAVDPAIAIELWDEAKLGALVRSTFGVELGALAAADVETVRAGVEAAKTIYAFGRQGPQDALEQSLLWHLGYWQLGDLRARGRLDPRKLTAPGTYRNVTVLLADLCSFSSYVRDTRDDAIVRDCLTSFYAKARYAILDCGGLFYNFVGDEAIALFGVPDGEIDPVAVLECADALLDVGQSVSFHWQKSIDRVQKTSGLHIGVATGDLQLVPLRPLSQSQWGVLGDGINLGSRLMNIAGPDQLVVSNSFYRQLPEAKQPLFDPMPDLDVKNVGSIRAWARRR